MRRIRIIADDLTGALDAAAQFTAGGREIPVYIGGRIAAQPPDAFSLDIASREETAQSAAALSGRFASLVSCGGDGVAFWKIDSLLRGNVAAGIAAALGVIRPGCCVVVPAFPYHGRVTRQGRLHLREKSGWRLTGPDLAADLAKLGVRVTAARPGDSIPGGVSLWDAETGEDLRRIAAAGAERGGILWCGSGGLASALAPSEPATVGLASLGRPVLGIFGSDHPATRLQLEALGDHVLSAPADNRAVAGRLAARGHCHVRFAVPIGSQRGEARNFIESQIASLCRVLPEPATLLVAGGETLRSLCQCLGADHLSVSGQVVAGMPVSRMVGGRWPRAAVLSKSGAFGDAGVLSLITAAPKK